MAQRYGLAIVVESGTALAGPVRPGLAALVGRAIELYEAYAEQRPPGWPESGPGALCALASLRRRGPVRRRCRAPAGAGEGDARGRAGARPGASGPRPRPRRRPHHAPPSTRWSFRRQGPPRIESAEARRQRVRDAVLLAGRNPAAWPNAALALAHLPIAPGADQVRLLDADRCEELDGIGARATRYRAELARGRWQLPDHRRELSALAARPRGGITA